MDQPLCYMIRFEGLETADAGRAAESLRRSLREVDPTIEAKRVRTDAEAMDFGATLSIMLAAPAIIKLAEGISNWLSRTHSSKLTVIGSDGTVIVENISAREAAGLSEKLQARHGRR